MPYSLSFISFKNNQTTETRNYWYCRTAFEYAERWWCVENKKDQYDRITDYGSDKSYVFNSIDISPTEYLNIKDAALWSIRCNTIINAVTSFEIYLYHQLKRAIYIKPQLIEKSGIEFSAGELSDAFCSGDQKEWIADEIVKKYIRNKSHSQMIKRIDNMILGGISTGQAELIERWHKKVTLRNALVHNARLINKELSSAWPDKFPNVGEAITLDDGNVIRTYSVAWELATRIDEQFNRTVILNNDARLLAMVIYLLHRDMSMGEIANSVYRILGYPFNKNEAESAVAYQKRTREYIPDFQIAEDVVERYFSANSNGGV